MTQVESKSFPCFIFFYSAPGRFINNLPFPIYVIDGGHAKVSHFFRISSGKCRSMIDTSLDAWLEQKSDISYKPLNLVSSYWYIEYIKRPNMNWINNFYPLVYCNIWYILFRSLFIGFILHHRVENVEVDDVEEFKGNLKQLALNESKKKTYDAEETFFKTIPRRLVLFNQRACMFSRVFIEIPSSSLTFRRRHSALI